MSSNMTVANLPNPLTPMAFFPPSVAFEITVYSYILVGTLTSMIWDIFYNIRDDYTLFTKHRIRLPTLVHCFSRISALASVLAQTIFQTAPLGHCAKFLMITTCLTSATIASTTLLFFFRLRALYRDDRLVVGFFFLLWLVVCGGSTTAIYGTAAENIGPTNYCIGGTIKQYVTVDGVVILVHDSLVFFAISWYLFRNTYEKRQSVSDTVKDVILGRNLPAFTRAFLQDGQIYYLINVGFGIVTTVVLHTNTIPLVYRAIVGLPNLMVMNVLACRVYRNTKLGVYEQSPASIVSNAVKDLKFLTIPSAGDKNRSTPSPGNTRPTLPPQAHSSLRGESNWEVASWTSVSSRYSSDDLPTIV